MSKPLCLFVNCDLFKRAAIQRFGYLYRRFIRSERIKSLLNTTFFSVSFAQISVLKESK